MERIIMMAEEFLRRHKFIRRWRKVLAVMMAMVVFMSTYSMILPAITMEPGDGPEIGLFADTSVEESAPDISTVTESIPEAGAEGENLTAETASLTETEPNEPASSEAGLLLDVPAENNPAEDNPVDAAPQEAAPAEPAASEPVPAESPPAETAPAESPPAESPPAETAPAESPPAETTPETAATQAAATAASQTAPKAEEITPAPEEPEYLENEKLIFEDGSMKLILTVPAAARVAKDASLSVREIGQPFANDGLDENGRKNEYLSYLVAAETSLSLTAEEINYIEKNIVNFPDAELPWARFFVISIKNADGAITPACVLPVEIIYKNTAETAADGLKVVCLLPNGTMTKVGSETKVAAAAHLSAADSNFDITSKFTDAGTLTFGTFAVEVSEIDAAIEKEKEEAAKAAAEAAKAEPALAESTSGTEPVSDESVPADASTVENVDESAPADASTAEIVDESVPADASTAETVDESLAADASTAETVDESLPTEPKDESIAESVPAEPEDESVLTEPEDESVATEPEDESLPAEDESVSESIAEEAETTDEEQAEEETKTEEKPEDADKETRTLVTKGPDYTVTMTYTADAEIPAGAKLSAKEILPTAYNYKGYMNDAVDALGLSETEAACARARFFDIKIMLGTSEITPAAPVRVDIEYTAPQKLASAENVKAVHFGKEGPQEVAISDVTTDKETAEVSGVAFEAGSFSVYGVVYTVDFTYDGYTLSIEGGSDIWLSEIIEILGLGIDVRDVAGVIFSDPSLVSVEKIWFGLGNDWILKSLNPFTTEETLTVFMADGTKFVISVHDLQYTTSLNDVLTGLTISGAEWDAANNRYVVKNGKNYSITLTFQEGEAAGQYQFSNDGWMTLTLPDGITFKAEGATFPITVNEAGEHFTISGNQVETVGDTIRVKLNSSDPNYQKLKDITTATFSIDVNGEFDSSHSEYTIDGKTDTKVKVDTANDVTIQKAGALTDWNSSAAAAVVTYTLRVTSNGTNNNVVINDAISGEVITYNGDAQVKKEATNETVNWSVTSTSTGFTMTTGEMKDGETYVITYTANIDKSKLNAENGSFALDSDSKNTVTWDGDHPSTYDLGHVVSAPGISKGAGAVTANGNNRTIPWTITAYSDYGTANQLTTVRDTIKTEGMHYAGDYVTVKVYDAVTNAPVDTKQIPWGSLGVDKNTAGGFTLNIIDKVGDNAGKKYKYEISYTTSYDAGSLTEYINVKNGYEDNRDHEGEGSAQIGPNPENQMGLGKTKESVTTADGKTIVTWHVTVTVPKAGLTATQAKLVDTLPKLNAYQDTYVDGSFRVVSGLQQGETAVINTAESTEGSLVINFTKDGTELGLNSSSDQRTVVLELQTLCDADWLADAVEDKADPTHTNNATFNYIPASASYTPEQIKIFKNGSQNGTTDSGLPKFSYTLTLSVISEELFANADPRYIHVDGEGKRYIELVDTFDSRLAYVAGSAKISGGYSRFNTGNAETELPANRAVYDEADHKVTFRLYQDELPKNYGTLYSYYRVSYDLQIKDKETYDALQEQVVGSGDHVVKLRNTVEGFGTNRKTIEYDPKILDKSHATVNGKLQFTITVNEPGLTLSDNGILVLTDKMTNLSVRYQDVTITVDGNKTVQTTDSEGNPVTAPYFNMKGDTITFYIPDGVKTTITYLAKAKGEPDETGQIHYHNEVDMLGFHKEDDGYENYVSDATGYGTNYGLNLYKGDGLVNSTGLGGAVFKLFEADEVDADGNIISGSPVKNADGSDYTVTTSDGRDGSAVGTGMIMGTEKLGWNLKPEKRYYLLEIVAPPGYALDNTKYSFIISKDGHVNYTRYPVVSPDGSGAIVQPWTYYNGDIVTVKNWRKDGVLTLTKSFAGLNTEEPDDDQKAAISFEVYKLNTETGDYELFRTIVFNQMVKNEQGKYTYTIGDLPEGQYKVVELVDDVTCKQTEYQVVDNDPEGTADNGSDDRTQRYATVKISETDVKNNTEHTVDISNTYYVPSEYKIYKYGSPANVEGETSFKLDGAKFAVYATDDEFKITGEALRTYETNSRGRFSILQTDVIAGEKTYEFGTLYAVKETEAPKGFEVNETVYYFYFLQEGEAPITTGLPEGTVQIGFMNSAISPVADAPSMTYIEAKKMWLNELLEEDQTKDTEVKVRIKQTAFYDKEGKVVEPALSGYYSAASEEPVTAERATTFLISKESGSWKLTQDAAADANLVDGKLTNLPTMTFDNHMPIFYKYEIEEIVPEGYTAFYEYGELENGGIGATVSNRPSDVAALTRVKAKKRWLDADDNDVTDKMGLSDSVSVNVYRTAGIISAGKIVEADGSKKDANKLYAIPIYAENNNPRARISTAFVTALPGDTIEITASVINGRGTFEGSGRYWVRESWGEAEVLFDFSEGSSGTKVARIVLPTDRQVTKIEVRDSGSYQFDVLGRNASADGRSQILSEAEAESIGGAIVETLNLNAANGWQNISREYPTGDGLHTVYTYYIVEENGSTFGAEYTFAGDSILVTNRNTKVEIDKTWFGADGVTDLTDSITDKTVSLKVYQKVYPPSRGEYTGLGSLNVSAGDDFKYGYPDNYGNDKPLTSENLSGTYQNIKAGSDIRITISSDGKYNTDPQKDEITINGQAVTFDYENRNTAPYYIRTVTLENVEEDIVFSGRIAADPFHPVSILIEVLSEPIDPELLATLEVGEASLSAESFTFVPKEPFSASGITASAGQEMWTGLINNLPAAGTYNGRSVEYAYCFEEIVGENDSYTLMENLDEVSTGGVVRLKNKLKPGSLKVTKAVEGAEAAGTFTIGVQDSEGNYYGTDGKNYGLTPHYETFAKDEVKTWTNLTPGTYTVLEKDASAAGYAWTVTGTDPVRVNLNETASVTVTNSYYKTTEYAPKITKALKLNEADVPADKWPAKGFEFYLSASAENPEGAKLGTREATATVAAKTAAFGAITFEKPGEYTFSIEEVQPAGTVDNVNDGIVYSTDVVTVTVVVEENEDHELHVESVKYSTDEAAVTEDEAIGEVSGLITNTPEVKDFEFTKKWKNANGTDWDEWVKDITVKLYRKVRDTDDEGFVKTFTLSGESGTENGISWTRSGDAESGYTFIFKDLEKYAKVTVDAGADSEPVEASGSSGTSGTTLETELVEYMYYAVEEKVSGYKDPSYGDGSGTIIVNAESAGNGGSIINTPEDAVELPATGGVGTTFFYILGALLVLGAGALLAAGRRRRV